jgi:hypothetical protein
MTVAERDIARGGIRNELELATPRHRGANPTFTSNGIDMRRDSEVWCQAVISQAANEGGYGGASHYLGVANFAGIRHRLSVSICQFTVSIDLSDCFVTITLGRGHQWLPG